MTQKHETATKGNLDFSEVVLRELFQPAKGTLDGLWEVGAVVEGYLKAVQRLVQDEKERSVTIALRGAVLASLEVVGGIKGLDSMDV